MGNCTRNLNKIKNDTNKVDNNELRTKTSENLHDTVDFKENSVSVDMPLLIGNNIILIRLQNLILIINIYYVE
jgi:hypothetical protein